MTGQQKTTFFFASSLLTYYEVSSIMKQEISNAVNLLVLAFVFAGTLFAQTNNAGELGIDFPDHGFISFQPPARWEEGLITGNGKLGALIFGNAGAEKIIFSHEKLFMPKYYPTDAPPIYKYLDEIRELVLDGKGEAAADLALKAGEEVGITDLIWTDPLIPACQLEFETMISHPVLNFARSVNYETGEATTAWQTEEGLFHRTMFVSRPENIAVLKITSPDRSKLNMKFRLSQLPVDEEELEVAYDDLIKDVSASIDGNRLVYTTEFKRQWQGSLKGLNVTAEVTSAEGKIYTSDGWLFVENASEVLILVAMKLFYSLPVETKVLEIVISDKNYQTLLAAHSKVHGEMFNRFSLDLTPGKTGQMSSEALLAASSYRNLSSRLVEQLCEASRYTLICSTGELPPTLQGIWGGTWHPAWSGDFTHNGNVPSAIASGFNTNFLEVMDAYTEYMFSMFDDFRANARDVYGFDGIFCLSRSSNSGKTYHYLNQYPHMYWFAGGAWFSQFFYDYWQYTGDGQFLKQKTIPFMLAALAFYKDLLVKDDAGRYMFIPSYSPEVGPSGHHPVVINATMDIAALKQLLRNIATLVEQGYVEAKYQDDVADILSNLPDYQIDENGELKEWLYPGFKNNNQHRHASHLYPLFYEVDPDFDKNPELIKGAQTAIENRMKYRRGKNGAEMAFGLVQKGLAAAHINDTALAYECVDWLCNSYWSPAFTSYHDPGEIFNVDICGGLPAVVTEMIVQSSMQEITLLPALPEQWPEGSIKGVRGRGGFVIDMQWKAGKPVAVTVTSLLGNRSKLQFRDQVREINLQKGQSKTWEF
jgi:hypothetical protein